MLVPILIFICTLLAITIVCLSVYIADEQNSYPTRWPKEPPSDILWSRGHYGKAIADRIGNGRTLDYISRPTE